MSITQEIVKHIFDKTLFAYEQFLVSQVDLEHANDADVEVISHPVWAGQINAVPEDKIKAVLLDLNYQDEKAGVLIVQLNNGPARILIYNPLFGNQFLIQAGAGAARPATVIEQARFLIAFEQLPDLGLSWQPYLEVQELLKIAISNIPEV